MRLSRTVTKRAVRLAVSMMFLLSSTPVRATNLPPALQTSTSTTSTDTASTGTTDSSSGTSSTTTTTTPTTTTSTSPSQYQAAVAGQNQNKDSGSAAKAIGMALLAMGMAMMAACAPPPQNCSCCPQAAQQIMQGLQGLAQGGANDSTAGSQGAQSTLSADSANTATYDVSSPDLSSPSDFSTNAEVKKALSGLTAYGYTFNPKKGTITTPSGSTLGTTDSASSWKNAGVTDEQLQSNLNAAKKVESKVMADEAAKKVGAHTTAQGFETASGGGTPSTPPREDPAITGGSGKPIERKPTSVAGMVRNYNGENIGVAGDDIFQMMARRYREKASKDSFLPPDSAPVDTIQ